MIFKRFLILLGFSLSLSMQAQDMLLCYDHVYNASRSIDTLKVYLKGDADTTLGIRAANFSVAYHDSCAVFDTLESYFTAPWSSFFELTQVSNGLGLTYNNRQYDARIQYGNSDPGLPMANPIFSPQSENDSLLLFTLIFRGTCSQKLYLENELENTLNQFGDETFTPIDYGFVACQGQDSVGFCARQQRDSARMVDSVRLFIEGNAEKRVELTEVNFSIAFHDSCASFDSLYSVLNSMWGDTLAEIEVMDSLQLNYGGISYDARLSYHHQNPNFSAFNVLETPTQTRFPDWVSTFYFSGGCSQDLYFEKQSENPENLFLNPLDRLVGYKIGQCDSLPEDTIVLMTIEDFFGDEWEVYPNPTRQQLFIKQKTSTIFKGNMQLMDMQGSILWEQKINRTEQQISVKHLPSGIYLLKIEEENGAKASFRILKK